MLSHQDLETLVVHKISPDQFYHFDGRLAVATVNTARTLAQADKSQAARILLNDDGFLTELGGAVSQYAYILGSYQTGTRSFIELETAHEAVCKLLETYPQRTLAAIAIQEVENVVMNCLPGMGRVAG